jgi:low affinity Fe/Cu permease
VVAPQSAMPSSVSGRVGWFDRFSAAASRHVSRAWFFAACVMLIVLWLPSYPLWSSGDVYQLVINTATTCVTFLLVALLQNSQQRADQATQHKLNAVAVGLAELLAHQANIDGADQLSRARAELCAAVGLEERETS